MLDDQLASTPAKPPRAGFLPGMRFRAAVPRSTLLFLLALVLFFAVFPLSIMSADPKAKLSFGPSTTSEGRVLSVADVSTCRGSAGRRIVYSFLPQSGNEYRGSTNLCEEAAYYSAQVGEQIPVRYLTRDPVINTIAGSDASEPPVFLFLIFPVFFLLLFSPMYFPQLREIMRARKLYKSGTVVQGKVIFAKKRIAATLPGWAGSSAADVYVAYQSPDGGQTETVVWCANEWLLNQLSPGATVHLLVGQNRAARGVLLEAFIR